MNVKRICLAVYPLVALLAADAARAGDHLVTLREAEGRLAQAEVDRQRDLGRVDAVLATDTARQAAAVVGADVDVLRAALPALSDAELRDLAARAAVLETDPLGAMDQDIKLLVIILLIALIVVVILSAVD
jgi:hypothetical protein